MSGSGIHGVVNMNPSDVGVSGHVGVSGQMMPPSIQSVPISQWSLQTINRIHSVFHSNDNSPPSASVSMFTNLNNQKNLMSQSPPSEIHQSVANFFTMVSLWGLCRLHTTEDLESRRQYALFINHLQSAENCLLKSIEIKQKVDHQNSNHSTLQSIPPTQTVDSLPLTTMTQQSL